MSPFLAFSILVFLLNLGYFRLHLVLRAGLRRLAPEGPAERRSPAPGRSPMRNSSPTPLPKPLPTTPPTVTVLIAARNEEEHLPALLSALAGQDYPRDRFEVIVVDDRSTDATAEILAAAKGHFPVRLLPCRVLTAPVGLSPKKNALTLGLESAQGEIILTTDADCLMGPGWIRGMVESFSPETGMVLGLTVYDLSKAFKEERPFFRQVLPVASLEFLSYGLVGAALIGAGFPVHGNANNLAYRRQAFADAGGFSGHAEIVSGDDDFLLQAIHASGRWEVRFSASPGTALTTAPPENTAHFWEQRKRWASKCGYYAKPQLFFLALIFLYYVLIAGLSLLGAITYAIWPFAGKACFLLGIGSFFIKTVCDYRVMAFGARILNQESLLKSFPLTALAHIPLILGAVMAGTFGSFEWKGQKVRKRASAAAAPRGSAPF